ncbi:hypothetical protein GCM10023260_14760 [Bartonella acomydis]|uniref:Uncharacterized protein n=1 Tax=Bartonella acomydis TaxID=686234 RepID=A0ABP9MYQ5_9HYPH
MMPVELSTRMTKGSTVLSGVRVMTAREEMTATITAIAAIAREARVMLCEARIRY